MKRTRADVVFDIFNYAIMVIVLIITIYPLYFTIIASFSDPTQVSLGNTTLWIKGFTIETYSSVFKNSEIWIGYRNTIFYTLFGTIFNLFLTIPTAYVLSRRHFPGVRQSLGIFIRVLRRRIGSSYLRTGLHLDNTVFTIIILGGLSVYNMIVTRVYFQNSVPEELYEAAIIDGASDFRQFFTIALPLSAPIIAVMALYYGVGRWNDYFTALIYQ